MPFPQLYHGDSPLVTAVSMSLGLLHPTIRQEDLSFCCPESLHSSLEALRVGCSKNQGFLSFGLTLKKKSPGQSAGG